MSDTLSGEYFFLPQEHVVFGAGSLAYSAAEFSHLVGVTDESAKMKRGFADTKLTPRGVILDARLTVTTPMQLTGKVSALSTS